MKYRFHPRILPTLATILCCVLFIRLGLWQLHKAEAKQALQAQFDRHLADVPVALPFTIDHLESWRYRHVSISGEYDTRYQILLDNQVENETAGYHVITPMRLEGSEQRILVDRGWIPAPAEHSVIPRIETPSGTQHITGSVWLPSTKIFTLQAPQTAWQTVWQNMDMERYMHSAPFKTLPLVIRLDANSPAGGFVRNWPRPAERVETNLSYAYQWFGFAVALVVIYLLVNLKKVEA